MTVSFPPSLFQRPSPARSHRPCRLVTIAAIALLLTGCSGGGQESGIDRSARKPATAVTTALVATRDVPVGIETTGRVEASASAAIKSQIGGVLETVHFTEGQQVHRGDVLFSIDPRPYQAEVANRKALLLKDRADLVSAERDLARYRPAAGKGYVSQSQADQAEAKVAGLKAAVQADQAALDSATLDLRYCSLKAPFDGLAGELQADAGNLIKANADTPLVTINRIAPADVAFDIAGERLGQVHQAMRDGRPTVEATLPGQETRATGTLSFIDNGIDPATGTIRLKAVFANDDRRLWPGQLVRVTLLTGISHGALVIPSQAVQVDQDGAHVFVVNDDAAVSYRKVEPGIQHDGLTVVDNGLKAGERVVTDGHLQLSDGATVEDRSGRPAAGRLNKEKSSDKEGRK